MGVSAGGGVLFFVGNVDDCMQLRNQILSQGLLLSVCPHALFSLVLNSDVAPNDAAISPSHIVRKQCDEWLWTRLCHGWVNKKNLSRSRSHSSLLLVQGTHP